MTKNQLPIEQIDVSHCLRREFTLNIIQALIHKRLSINLIGEKGTGKTRLLEDISNCKLPDTVIVFVNLKSYVNNYKGLVREIYSQLGLNKEIPERLDQLFEGLEKQPVRYLVFLDNYSALLDNPGNDEGYDVNFFDDLNFIKNKDNICLVCTTCQPHNSQPVFINKKSYRNSWLTLEKEMLPSLTRNQILQELERQVGDDQWPRLESNFDEKELALEYILKLPLPYPRLWYLAGKFNKKKNEEIDIKFKKRLNKEMVNIANTQHRKKMTMSDLEEILKKHIYRPENIVNDLFWRQFCEEEAMKKTVQQIITDETPTDKKSLFKLLEHGFILKEDDHYKMRVPIFENWVKEFGEVV